MATRGWEQFTEADLQRAKWSKQAATPKPAKYRNERVVVAGEKFDSKRESTHWLALKAREAAGEISELRRQVTFPLYAPILTQSEPWTYAEVGFYVADFVWRDRSGVQHVADAKGGKATQTSLFRFKAKHLNLQDGITIEIL